MKSIEFLDISHNNFHGKLPKAFVNGCSSLRVLKLSHNKLSGEILLESANFTGILEMSMDDNQFTGNIGQALRSLRSLVRLDISRNKLTGVIPTWFDELPQLGTLRISNNLLEGEIPTSLFNISGLRLLDLSANILSGHMNSGNEEAILLPQDNNLSGAIPDTLLAKVAVLDLRNNILSGNVPEFVNTQSIRILLLRGNNLRGRIPEQVCGLRKIHLLDVANNRLNGSIPSCLCNSSFGSGKEDTFYSYDNKFIYTLFDFQGSSDMEHDSTSMENARPLLNPDLFSMDLMEATRMKIEFATKHRYDAYIGENLKYLFGMDLSGNELSGEIPIELGGLMELQALNLSHNNLVGVIPESFSSMKNVESLDLSFNRLQGRIPPKLTELSSLAVFNVSFNNLSGVIPRGRQFNTFDKQSYLGNHLLCGQPTNRICDSINFQEQDYGVEADESTIEMVSFYWSCVAAYVTVLLGIFASLSFDSPWSRSWFYIVDAFIHKVRNFLS